MSLDPIIVETASATSAAIFAGSAAMKLMALDEFRAAVENYRIVPRWAVGAVAWVVPLLELAGAAGAIWPGWRRPDEDLLLALIALFTCAIAINLVRGRRDIDCGCFGPMLRQRLSGWLVARNAILAMVVIVADASASSRPLEAFDYATILPAASALVLLYAAVNYLIASAPMTNVLRMGDA